MKKIATLTLTALLLVAPLGASATIDRAYIYNISPSGNNFNAGLDFFDGATWVASDGFSFPVGTISTTGQLETAALAGAAARTALLGYSVPNGYFWEVTQPSEVQSMINASKVATSSNVTMSLQTSTGAVGTQVSTTSDAMVTVSGQVTTTASIAGNSSGDIIVEVAPTNSATSTDWIEWGRIGNSQALSLAIALQSVQTTKSSVSVLVPKGWYIKARTTGSGTVSYQLNTVKKITQ